MNSQNQLLEKILRQRILVDSRARKSIDRYQAGAGVKRTTIRDARVYDIEGGAAAIKNLTLGMPTDAGVTVRGTLQPGPMLRTAFHQGELYDCFLLSTMLAIILINPNYFDGRILIPITLADGTPGVLVQLYEAKTKSIVHITTSTDVSTSYDNPADGDIRPEILEKCYGFFRSGVADYLKDNFGTGTEAGIAFGFTPFAARQAKDDPAQFIATHRAAGRLVTILTAASAKTLIPDHCYAGLSAGMIINPWYGDQDFAVTDATLKSAAEVAALYALSESSPAILSSMAPSSPAIAILSPIESTSPPVISVVPGTTAVPDAFSGVTFCCSITGAISASLAITGASAPVPLDTKGGCYSFQLNDGKGNALSPREVTCTAIAADGSHATSSPVSYSIATAGAAGSIYNTTLAATNAPTVAEAKERVAARLLGMPPAAFSFLLNMYLSGHSFIYQNRWKLSDRDTPLTPQECFDALGTQGGAFMAALAILIQAVNAAVPGTITPDSPAPTVNPDGTVTVGG